jgi:hypothetical protein
LRARGYKGVILRPAFFSSRPRDIPMNPVEKIARSVWKNAALGMTPWWMVEF